jgi:hypothetical protein
VPPHVLHVAIAHIYSTMVNVWLYVPIAHTTATRHASPVHLNASPANQSTQLPSAYSASTVCIWACHKLVAVYQNAKIINTEISQLVNAIIVFHRAYHARVLQVVWVVLTNICFIKLNVWLSQAVLTIAIYWTELVLVTVEIFGLSNLQPLVQVYVLLMLWNLLQLSINVFRIVHRIIL